MKLSQLSVKVFLVLAWILWFPEVVRSQSGNMSDITLPSPDAIISDPSTEEATPGTETPTEEVTTGETETPTNEVTTPETEEAIPTEEVITPETETPTEEVTTGETETPTQEAIAEEAIPTEEVTTPETETPTQEAISEEAIPTEEITTGETETPTEEVTINETNALIREAIAEEIFPTQESTTDESITSIEEVATPATEISANEDNKLNAVEENFVPAVDSNSDSARNPNTEENITEDIETSSAENSVVDTDREIEAGNESSSEDEASNLDREELGVENNAKIAEETTKPEDSAESQIEEEAETTEESSEEAEAEEAEESSEANTDVVQLDRVAYEAQFQEAPNDLAIMMQEEFQLTQFIDSSGLQLYGTVPSVQSISRRLAELAEQTGKTPAFINISLQSDRLESFVVLPDRTVAGNKNTQVASTNLNGIDSQPEKLTVRKTVKNTSRQELIATATEFRAEISDIRKLDRTNYLTSARELYRVLIEPIEAELEANNIDILVFSLDSGLRLLPVAALYDGEQFLVEKYAMGIVPSFGLTDTRYVNPNQSSILAMGASEFEEQTALPTMPLELEAILRSPRQGESFLNEQFTIDNFVAQNSRETPFSIIHLGTHAEFKAGDSNDSYIQFYDDKLKIPQLQQISDQLGWNTNASPVDLLVLSACETALGDKEAELGFAGLAVQAGVKSALASLWYVSDLGTLALMGEFYDRLGDTLIKAEALRQTQLQMLHEKVKIDDRQVVLSNGDLVLPENYPQGTLSLSHPYFWSAFTLIGNWN